jgi:6-phosphofructokinase 1
MNASIRTIVRTAIKNGYSAYGIYDGFSGLIKNEIKEFKWYDVSSISNKGIIFF